MLSAFYNENPHIDGSAQDCSNSIANALELLQPCANPSIYNFFLLHYGDVIMSVIASQITSLTIVYSSIYSGADQRKHQSSASLAFVKGIHRRPVNSPHKGPVTREMFPFDDVIMGWIPVSWGTWGIHSWRPSWGVSRSMNRNASNLEPFLSHERHLIWRSHKVSKARCLFNIFQSKKI